MHLKVRFLTLHTLGDNNQPQLTTEQIAKILNTVQIENQDKSIEEYQEIQKNAMERLDLVIKKLNSLDNISKKQSKYIEILENKIIRMNKKFNAIKKFRVSSLNNSVVQDLFSDDSSLDDNFTISDDSLTEEGIFATIF